jgi:PAS domain S-box-containing protein
MALLLYHGRPKPGQQGLGGTRHLWVPLAALVAIFLSHPIAAEPPKEIRRILILNEVGTSYPGIRIVNEGIQAALNDSPYRLQFYSEYMDTSLFPDPAVQQEFREFYIRKYQNRKPDVIITVGPSPLKFMQEVHQRVFPGVPIVFCLPNGSVPGAPALDSDFTGVENDMAPAETVEIGLQLQPGTKNVVVVGGVAPFDREGLAAVKKALKPYEGRLDITYLTDLAVPDLLNRLQHLPNHTLVLLTSVGQDAAGTSFKANEISPLVVAAANAPVFGLFDVFLNHGEVGGYLSSLSEQGKAAGDMALGMLEGKKPRDIPLVKGVNTYMFDWRAIKRWGLMEKEIPPGSIVLNRQLTMWESYKWYIIGGTALFLGETMLIFGLLWQRAKRRRSEGYSRELVLRSPVATVVIRLLAQTNELVERVELVNHKFTELFGYTIEDVPDDASWWPLAYPDKAYREAIKSEWQRRVKRALVERKDIEPLEASVRCKDGSYRHIEFHFASFGDTNLVKFMDLTDRRRADVELRESEERFRRVANTAPVLIWMSGPDKLCNYFNQPWLDFTGRSLEVELGNGWSEGVHPEDLKDCLDIYTRSFDLREPFKMEYRLRRHDGEYRWVVDIGVPRLNLDGSFAGYIGSCLDITDHKLAEEALGSMGRRLIEAHEEERTRIARELHDDINQRVALLSIQLGQWAQHRPNLGVEVTDHISHVRQELSDLGNDIQALSHRLHSSKLDYLGLAAAAGGFCRELSERQNVDIDFSHAGIPRNLPKEISLCMFRVLQEALQNAVKHSGVRHFKVELSGDSGDIQLSVSDLGVGFDPQDAMDSRGLGLISMRERLQLVGGDFSIQSEPGHGSTICARVPLRPDEIGNGASLPKADAAAAGRNI